MMDGTDSQDHILQTKKSKALNGRVLFCGPVPHDCMPS